jgi:hypothetical protein
MEEQKLPTDFGVTASAATTLAQYFEAAEAGARYVLNAFPTLLKTTISNDLKGKFEEREIKLLIDVTNATMLTYDRVGQHLLANVEEGITLDKLDQKWEIHGGLLVDKLRIMTVTQLAMLEIWICGFWNQGGNNLDDYIANIL